MLNPMDYARVGTEVEEIASGARGELLRTVDAEGGIDVLVYDEPEWVAYDMLARNFRVVEPEGLVED